MCVYKGYLHFELVQYRALKMVSEAVRGGSCEEKHGVLRVGFMCL